MKNKNLPVLLLRNVVLFPSNELRLELDTLEDRKVLSLAEGCFKNNIVIVHPSDPLETNPDFTELPKIGVLSEIKMKMDMPNGKTRIILVGLERIKIDEYKIEDNIFSADIDKVEIPTIEAKEELAYIRTIKSTLEKYIKEIPYMSNSLLTEVIGMNNLNTFTDIVTSNLPQDYLKKIKYIEEITPETRAKKLLDDMTEDLNIIELERKIEEKINRELEKTQKEYVLREKIKQIKLELGDIKDKDNEVDELRKKIINLDAPIEVKERLNLEISRYESTNPNSPEVGIIRNYIDWLLSLPWNTETKDNDNLRKVKDKLDSSHFGLEKVKERIIEYLAVKQNNKNVKSPILCLVGPPGVGKTSLAKSIGESLNREVTKISVGGINDEAEIVGHRRTYIGAAPGLIIQGMKKVGTKNPVFIIDEIDKMTKDIKGDPASALLEILDPEQNKKFSDHYIEEPFDLSKVMFLTTANYYFQIPVELRDRLEIIELSSYTEYEKLDIAKKHLIPRELETHGLKKDFITFSDEVILKIIRNYTKESGVRNLDRQIASIIRKIVTEKVLGESLEEYKITIYNLEKYLGKSKYFYGGLDIVGHIGVVNGLAYTEFGGDVLQVEATLYKGKGNIILTGSLGEVMRESATVAISYIKTHAEEFHVDLNIIENNDIHIHIPEGAIPKDGPSAGSALVTTLISLFTNTLINTNVAMTGEMTLRGKILPIGGLKEKVIGGHRSGIRKIFIPRINEKDLEDVPEEIKREIEFILVDRYMDIYKNLFKLKRKSEIDETNRIRLQFD
ncbi:MAG: endopeptidase La [Bacilli bacterium]|nr:endopeptidase La [Bacilli bacterium]